MRQRPAMRLTPDEIRAIVTAAQDLVGPDASVRLFGSRLRDDVRGGAIDLLVACAQPVARPVWLAAQITARLQRALVDRRFNVLVAEPGSVKRPVHGLARAEGILLMS